MHPGVSRSGGGRQLESRTHSWKWTESCLTRKSKLLAPGGPPPPLLAPPLALGGRVHQKPAVGGSLGRGSGERWRWASLCLPNSCQLAVTGLAGSPGRSGCGPQGSPQPV